MNTGVASETRKSEQAIFEARRRGERYQAIAARHQISPATAQLIYNRETARKREESLVEPPEGGYPDDMRLEDVPMDKRLRTGLRYLRLVTVGDARAIDESEVQKAPLVGAKMMRQFRQILGRVCPVDVRVQPAAELLHLRLAQLYDGEAPPSVWARETAAELVRLMDVIRANQRIRL